MKRKAIAWLLLISVVFGGLKTFQLYQRRPNNINQPKIEKQVEKNNPNVQETIITTFRRANEIVVNTAELKSETNLHKWSGILKQGTDIKIVGTGRYVVDLSTLKDDQLIVNNTDITVYLPTPKCIVELKPDKYTFSKNNGILMFSDLEVTPQTVAALEQQAKTDMVTVMQEPDNMKKAKNEIEATLTTVLRNLTRQNYNVRTIFIENNVVMAKRNSKKSIVIDAGHGGKDVGAVYKGINEATLTNETANRLKKELEKEGYVVTIVHGIDLMDRVAISNNQDTSLYISLHYNSAPNPQANGYETVIDYRDTDAYNLNKQFIDSFCNKLGLENRGVMQRKLFTRHINAPHILIELGFGSNSEDLAYVRNHQWSITNALKTTIIDMFENEII